MDPTPTPTNGNGIGIAPEQQTQAPNSEIDLDFLPAVYDVIKSIEKDPTQDPAGKPRESQDTSAKVLQLEKKLNEARAQIVQLAGIEHSKEEQLRQLELCRHQVVLKQQLIAKYRNLCTFSLSDYSSELSR